MELSNISEKSSLLYENIEFKQSYSKRKDANPLDTITKIQKILAKYNITPVQGWVSKIHNPAQSFVFSNRVMLNGLGNVGCNGKGTNIEYTLASALGETMERLESLALINQVIDESLNIDLYTTKIDRYVTKEEFCNIKNSFFNKYQSKIFKRAYPEKNSPEFDSTREFIDFLSQERALPPDIFQLSQYYSYKDKETVELPFNILENFISCSSGLSAGNTKEEAIVQALSEIFERHSKKTILIEDLNMPDVPYEKYSQYNDIIKIIKRYDEIGIEIKIKDASLGKNFPVIACIATEKQTNKSMVNFGSHPILPIAIERCLTEISQGAFILDCIKGIYTSYNDNYFDSFYFNKTLYCYQHFIYAKVPFNKNLLTKELTWEFDDKTWENNSTSNKELLKKMIRLCEEKDYDIYLKDFSFLDFPCFHIFIPQISILEDNLEVTKQSYLLATNYKYILNFLDKLKNNTNVENVYRYTTLLFNRPSLQELFIPAELAFLIPIIAGIKLKKYDQLKEIKDLFILRIIDKKPVRNELMELFSTINFLIDRKDFEQLDNHAQSLLDYCYKIVNEDIENEDNRFNRYKQENSYKETCKLKQSFIEILKTRKEKAVDNIYMKDFFEEIMK